MIHVTNGKGCDPYDGAFQKTRQRVEEAMSFYAWQSPRTGMAGQVGLVVWGRARGLLFRSLHYGPLTIVRRLI